MLPALAIPIILKLLQEAAKSPQAQALLHQLVTAASNNHALKGMIDTFDKMEAKLGLSDNKIIKSAVKSELKNEQKNEADKENKNTNKEVSEHLLLLYFAQNYLQNMQNLQGTSNAPSPENIAKYAHDLENWVKDPKNQASPQVKAFNQMATALTNNPTQAQVGQVFNGVKNMAVQAATATFKNALGMDNTANPAEPEKSKKRTPFSLKPPGPGGITY